MWLTCRDDCIYKGGLQGKYPLVPRCVYTQKLEKNSNYKKVKKNKLDILLYSYNFFGRVKNFQGIVGRKGRNQHDTEVTVYTFCP